MTGTVTMFNATKGYGFIEAGRESYFVHYSNIIGNGFRVLGDGDLVEFEPQTTPRGPAAFKVAVLQRKEERRCPDRPSRSQTQNQQTH